MVPSDHAVPDPKIAIDFDVFQRVSIDAVATLVELVRLPLAPCPLSDEERRYWNDKYENGEMSLAYITAATELSRLGDEVSMRSLYDDGLKVGDARRLQADLEKIARLQRSIASQVSEIGSKIARGSPGVAEKLLRAVDDAFEHWPRSIPSALDAVERVIQRARRPDVVKAEMSFARSIIVGDAMQIEVQKRRLAEVGGEEAAQTLESYLAPRHHTGSSREFRLRTVVRDSVAGTNGKNDSLLQGFIRGDLAESYKFLFGLEPGQCRQQTKRKVGSMADVKRVDGPFIRFALAVLIMNGITIQPASVNSALQS